MSTTAHIVDSFVPEMSLRLVPELSRLNPAGKSLKLSRLNSSGKSLKLSRLNPAGKSLELSRLN